MGIAAMTPVLLTWKDVARQAEQLLPDLRELLSEILASRGSTSDTEAGVDGPWYLVSVQVQGHVGIGEVPVTLPFLPTPGITVIDARNGTGKTSVADGLRHTLGNGRPRSYELADHNVHYPTRAITVVITNGAREVELTCSGDSPVQWRDRGSADRPVPAAWIAAFERYRPVLLYPEISPIIDKPGTLHEFLKGALELTVLEELLADVDSIRKQRRAVEAKLKVVHETAVIAVRKAGNDELAGRLAAAGFNPTEPTCNSLRAIAEQLPSMAPPAIELVETWAPDDASIDKAIEGIAALEQAKAGVVAGAESVQSALNKLLREEGAHLATLRDTDVCPVCGRTGAGWVSVAQAEEERLRELVGAVRNARRGLTQRLDRVRGCLPPALSPRTRQALTGINDPELVFRSQQWDALASQAACLAPDAATVETIEKMVAESKDLSVWYAAAKTRILSDRDATLSDQVAQRAAISAWLDAVDGARSAIVRATVADRLAERVEGWLKSTRAGVFEPISAQVVEIWQALASDGDLDVTKIALAGGVRQQRKVAVDLSVGGTPLPPSSANTAVLSTGQRNALSLATYLPRATQESSPYRFLVLDDPIHVLDDARVRYLAKYLISLADRYQIIVFTHDYRLWRQLCALGYRPTHMRLDRPIGERSHVRVKNITRPGEQMLDEVQMVLDQESTEPLGTAAAWTAMTLAICRQALDAEVVTQLEILGRRLRYAEETIRAALDRTKKTRDQLDLLTDYARRAGLSSVIYTSYNATITALNAGAHGRAPTPATLQECRQYVKDTRRLIQLVNKVTN